MLISQTFRGSPTLDQKGYFLLQKWYRLTPEKKHEIIKELADGLRTSTPGTQIRTKLEDDINKAVPDAEIVRLNY